MTRKWHQRNSIRALFTLVFILLLILGYPVIKALLSPPLDSGSTLADQRAGQGMPWDLKTSSDGQSISVFGLSPGISTLADAYRLLGNDLQIAVLTPANGFPVLEAYLDPLRTGPLTGKLILATEVDPAQITHWIENSRKRQISETGAKINTPAESDMPQISQSIITSVNYLPAADLDEATIVSRFGKPESRSQPEEGLVLLRYPQLGLLISVSNRGKEVFQYVQPGRFGRYFPG